VTVHSIFLAKWRLWQYDWLSMSQDGAWDRNICRMLVWNLSENDHLKVWEGDLINMDLTSAWSGYYPIENFVINASKPLWSLAAVYFTQLVIPWLLNKIFRWDNWNIFHLHTIIATSLIQFAWCISEICINPIIQHFFIFSFRLLHHVTN
jgi:hypothetical protein